MNSNTTFTNVFIVIILVLLVAFGVWYFTLRSGTETAPERNTIEVNLGGDATAEPPEQGTLDPSQ